MSRVETELCAYSVEGVERAAAAGLTRVELCAEPELEGTTPSFETIVAAREAIDRAVAASVAASVAAGTTTSSVCASTIAERSPVVTRLFVMIRPRGGDFVYTDEEFETMCRQIEMARRGGADGVVFGLLTAVGDVDVARARQLVEQARARGGEAAEASTLLGKVVSAPQGGVGGAELGGVIGECRACGCEGESARGCGQFPSCGRVSQSDGVVMTEAELMPECRPMGVTFHRAFDAARDWRAALEEVIGCGCDRVLSSGQATGAFEGRDVLRAMVGLADGRIDIMAGAGVNPLNAGELIAAGVDALHFSARVADAGGVATYADEEFIRRMVEVI